MSDHATLLACLAALPRPTDAEEWVADAPLDASTPVPTAYRQGVQDLLTALGVLSTDGDAEGRPRFTSPMSYYLVRSLIALLQDAAQAQHPLSYAWQGRASQPCEGLGARFVNLIESYRADCLPSPTPLREIRAVAAVIKARHDGQDAFLMQYDPQAEQFQLIGGKREVYDADDEAALVRELCEELNLASVTPGSDVRLHLLLEQRGEQKVSATTQLMTRYSHSFFHLMEVRFPLLTDQHTRWLTLPELDAGRAADGRTISKLLDALPAGMLAALPYSVLR
jgi:8-oxo-dGTP pyrophosphatase MutT (NUDIX family)